MPRPSLKFPTRHRISSLLAVLILGSCTDSPTAPEAGDAAFARAGSSDISVTAANPPYGEQGETNKLVRISGAGFEPGYSAAWERNGKTDPGVKTLATRFISETELEAEISISLDASLDLYDIVVRGPGGKKGIGLELFEVRFNTNVISECGGQTLMLDSRVVLIWSGSIRGDAAGDTFVGGQNGVHAKLFYQDIGCSVSGDMIFDPDFNANGSQEKRSLTFHFPVNDIGLPTTGIASAPFVNFRGLQFLGSDIGVIGIADGRDAQVEMKIPGAPRALEFPSSTADRPDYPNYSGSSPAPRIRMNVGLPGCDLLEFFHIRLTRMSGVFAQVGTQADGTPIGRWSTDASELGTWVVSTVESDFNGVSGHWAQCYTTRRNKTQSNGSPMHIPFSVFITEIR